MSRNSCERFVTQNHTMTSVIISIRSTNDIVLPNLPCNHKNKIKDVLFIAFDDVDIDSVIKYKSAIGLISSKQAQEIYQFCDKWYNNVDQFIFHCDGGISRSAGCCAAIMRWFESDDWPIFKLQDKHPNMYCYNKVLDVCRGIVDVDVTSRFCEKCNPFSKI